MTTTPSVAILVATRNRPDKIGAMMRSILAGDTTDFEAVVVDQSDDDATKRALGGVLDDPRIRYVRSSERGVSRARHQAVERTTAPYLVIADDDCVLPADWLASITAPLVRDEHVGIVFCTVVPVPFDVPGHTPHIEFTADRVLTRPAEAWRAGRFGLPLGAGMAIRRAAYDAVGGFDQALGAGGRFGSTEDSDLSWRTMNAGWSTVHARQPVVVHDGYRDLDEFRSLVERDLRGMGGALSKYLRRGPWRQRLGAARFLLGWILRLGVPPLVGILRGERPAGLRRPLLILGGLADGLRTPLDPDQLMFERPPVSRPATQPTAAPGGPSGDRRGVGPIARRGR